MVVVWCVEAVGILNVREEWGGGMIFPIRMDWKYFLNFNKR